ncbi:MAG: two-component regulator propeller domain-containing protein [Bacteroidota bacterium]
MIHKFENEKLKKRTKKLVFFFITLSFFACNQNANNKTVPSVKKNPFKAALVLTPGADTVKLPLVVLAGKPNLVAAKAPVTQNSPLGIPQFTTFTSNDGLALDAISCSIMDKSGNLWFGTNGGGVSKYDGKSFMNYTMAQGLANNVVRSIIEDKKGILWIGTQGGGVSRYDGVSFSNYTTTQGLANNVVLSITEDKNQNLWFGTYGGGVSKYDGKSFKNYTVDEGLTNSVILSIAEDKRGNLWFGSDAGGVSRYDGKKFRNYTTADGLANNMICSITEDKNGNLWFGSDEGGVSKYDGKSFKNYTTAQGLVNNSVMSIIEDKIGNLWFGTQGGGVSKYDGKSFTNYTTAHGLANNLVMSIIEDKSGNIWFGTYGSGLSRYGGNSFTNYSINQGLANNMVMSITEDKSGNLWFGTYGGGVSKYSGKSFFNYSTTQGLVNDVVMCSVEDKSGSLWFGTNGGGVSRYDGKSFSNYSMAQGLVNNMIWSILEDKSGNLWFGTYGSGVIKFDGNSFTNYTTAQGLANNVVLSIIEDKSGNLWFGTNGGGVSKYNGNSFTNYTTAQGLANNMIWSITQDKSGNLWFGTDGGGVIRYDGKSFINYTTAQGLPDNVVTQVVVDNNGKNMVIATNFGMCRGVSFIPKTPFKSTKIKVPFQNNLSNEELTVYYDLVLETYNSATTYPVKDINVGQNSLLQDSKGIYWAGTGSNATALVRADFNALNRNPKPPTPVLYRVKLNEENVCYYTLNSNFKIQDSKEDSTILAQQEIITYGKALSVIERDTLRKQFTGIEFNGTTSFYPIPLNLVLPYEHNNVTFEFNAVQLSRAHLLNFQYMLEGYDKTWSPVLKKHEATFGNISEGTYTFKLKVQYDGPDGNNEWSEVLTYTFKVLPPWYRTWWAYSVYLFIGGFVIWLVYRWRIAALMHEKKLLEEKVEARTHQLSEQKKVVEEKHKEITDSINYAERIQRSFLATKEHLNENLNDYFIFFKPRDVVSGDFYWSATLTNGLFALVTADSTGHGVPGAIMSLLNISGLEKAIETNTEPAAILNSTRKTIIERLKKDGSAEGGKDGMDASLTVYDFKNKKLTIASANNPVWIVRPCHSEPSEESKKRDASFVSMTKNEIIEIKPDKMPIGKHDRDTVSFTQQEIDLQSGDVVYTLTDGFPDQFGGENGKKFMIKKLRELLAANAHLTMPEQKQLLKDTFANWVGNMEQVDDVCLIGVKI